MQKFGSISQKSNLTFGLGKSQPLTEEESAKKQTMKIGKYKGQTFSEIYKADEKYLSWFVDNVINNDNRKYYVHLLKFMDPQNQPSKHSMVSQ
jgi:hypothetical protein